MLLIVYSVKAELGKISLNCLNWRRNKSTKNKTLRFDVLFHSLWDDLRTTSEALYSKWCLWICVGMMLLVVLWNLIHSLFSGFELKFVLNCLPKVENNVSFFSYVTIPGKLEQHCNHGVVWRLLMIATLKQLQMSNENIVVVSGEHFMTLVVIELLRCFIDCVSQSSAWLLNDALPNHLCSSNNI